MRPILLVLTMLCMAPNLFAQFIYTIKADSVKITNNCDTAELILENHTQNVLGFLYNKGKGRTEFRKAYAQLNDTTFIFGGDTVSLSTFSLWRKNGSNIYNINPDNVGIRRQLPLVRLDVAGSVNIDDTAAYRMKYRPILKAAGWIDSLFIGVPDQESSVVHVRQFTNIYVGDSAGTFNSGKFTTLIGTGAGLNSVEDLNTFAGYYSGRSNGATLESAASANSFFGAYSGEFNKGDRNTLLGLGAGRSNNGNYNTIAGAHSGENTIGNENSFFGNGSGIDVTGSQNSCLGAGSGSSLGGDNNVFIGFQAGYSVAGNENILIGASAGYNALINNVTLIGSNTSAGTVANSTALGAGAVVNDSNTMVFGNSDVERWIFNSGATSSPGIALVVGTNSTNGNGAYLTTGGAWTNASDFHKKEKFEKINSDEILEKIAALPLSQWKYKGVAGNHIGPVAQDFYQLFKLGTDNKSISTIDPSGVALAGIQGLLSKYKNSLQQITSLQAKIEDQNKNIEDIQSRLLKQETTQKDLQEQIVRLMQKIETLERQVNKTESKQ